MSNNIYPGPIDLQPQKCYNAIHNHQPRTATYRCKYMGRLEWTDIGNGNQICHPPGIPEMAVYWISSSANHSDYVACKDCISYKVCHYFTHHPNGWMESQNIAIYNKGDYEPIDMRISRPLKLA